MRPGRPAPAMGPGTEDTPVTSTVKVLVRTCTHKIAIGEHVSFGPLSGLKSDISRGPRSATCRYPGWHLRSLRLRLGEADRRSMRRGQISTSPSGTERREALLICKSVSHQKSLKGT